MSAALVLAPSYGLLWFSIALITTGAWLPAIAFGIVMPLAHIAWKHGEMHDMGTASGTLWADFCSMVARFMVWTLVLSVSVGMAGFTSTMIVWAIGVTTASCYAFCMRLLPRWYSGDPNHYAELSSGAVFELGAIALLL